MDFQSAIEIINENEEDDSEKNVILRGLQILAKYGGDTTCHFGDEFVIVVVDCNDFEKIVAKMSEEDVAQMAKLGWLHNDGDWTHY